MTNRSIKDALVAEEKFFRSHPVRKCHCLVVSNIHYMSFLYTNSFCAILDI
jgi:hypothetical protein